jgi:hypothetical protein
LPSPKSIILGTNGLGYSTGLIVSLVSRQQVIIEFFSKTATKPYIRGLAPAAGVNRDDW